MSSESGHTEKLGIDDCTVPETNVSVYDALYRRRMAWDFKNQPVPRDALARMLDTAIWAPNHRLTEPWRFFILKQETKRAHGRIYASVCCAAHNIALAGVAEGLAVTWETGGPTRHPDLARTLGAEEDWELATMLSIGYPTEDPPSKRTPLSNFVQWLE
ncbi:Putative NAD(P)H nitroreductase YfhC [Geodia barretti]|uniref:NAD(P)H nitroreductase YfhC n=1 Tax=Geodia barretti TaxID=519541 RepID=A0AA35WHJ1_GEOBA|nr:Putative NAD(P)H nitroreductase YfhC [Geodia barretti]